MEIMWQWLSPGFPEDKDTKWRINRMMSGKMTQEQQIMMIMRSIRRAAPPPIASWVFLFCHHICFASLFETSWKEATIDSLNMSGADNLFQTKWKRKGLLFTERGLKESFSFFYLLKTCFSFRKWNLELCCISRHLVSLHRSVSLDISKLPFWS